VTRESAVSYLLMVAAAASDEPVGVVVLATLRERDRGVCRTRNSRWRLIVLL